MGLIKFETASDKNKLRLVDYSQPVTQSDYTTGGGHFFSVDRNFPIERHNYLDLGATTHIALEEIPFEIKKPTSIPDLANRLFPTFHEMTAEEAIDHEKAILSFYK